MRENEWENQYSEVNSLHIDVNQALADLDKAQQVDSFEDAVRIVHKTEQRSNLTIQQALKIVSRQMEISGLAKITIRDYDKVVKLYQEATGKINIFEVDEWSIFDWLESMEVSNQTKLTRLKCFKAFLGKCLNNGMFQRNFWSHINVKVEKKIIEGADIEQVRLLMSLMDLNTFVGLRDYLAISMMIDNGLRCNTIAMLTEKSVDFETLNLSIDGSMMKNRVPMLQPITEKTAMLFKILMNHNRIIRNNNKVKNNYLFLSVRGVQASTQSGSRNLFRDRLRIYCERYGLNHMTPHDLRRAYSRNLYDKGATVLEISKALNHSSLAVTTDYLFMSDKETSNNLRKYLE